MKSPRRMFQHALKKARKVLSTSSTSTPNIRPPKRHSIRNLKTSLKQLLTFTTTISHQYRPDPLPDGPVPSFALVPDAEESSAPFPEFLELPDPNTTVPLEIHEDTSYARLPTIWEQEEPFPDPQPSQRLPTIREQREPMPDPRLSPLGITIRSLDSVDSPSSSAIKLDPDAYQSLVVHNNTQIVSSTTATIRESDSDAASTHSASSSNSPRLMQLPIFTFTRTTFHQSPSDVRVMTPNILGPSGDSFVLDEEEFSDTMSRLTLEIDEEPFSAWLPIFLEKPSLSAMAKMPAEIMDLILTFYTAMVVAEHPICDVFPAFCLPADLVCRRWHDLLERIKWQYLIAAPHFLVRNSSAELTPSLLAFNEWFTSRPNQAHFDIVSFTLDRTGFEDVVVIDEERARVFMHALTCCHTARVEVNSVVDLPPNQPTFSQPGCPELRDFSWTSRTLGIRTHLPVSLGFPWSTLLGDIPWRQLTRVSLDCPLSEMDVFWVLSCGRAKLKYASFTRLLAASLVNDEPLIFHESEKETKDRIGLPQLDTLKLHTETSLVTLLSKFDLRQLCDLDITVMNHSSLMGVPVGLNSVLKPDLVIAWSKLHCLSLCNDTETQWDITAVLRKCDHLRQLTLSGRDDAFLYDSLSPSVKEIGTVEFNIGGSYDGLLQSLKGVVVQNMKLAALPLEVLGALQRVMPTRLLVAERISPQNLRAILEELPNLESGEFWLACTEDVITHILDDSELINLILHPTIAN